jgi:membrane protease YdiL (CAAX protease family)
MSTAMTARERGRRAAAQLWIRIADIRRVKRAWWALIAFLFMPAVSLITYGIVRLLGLPLPVNITVAYAQAPVLFVVYFLGAVLEEIGWTGYATEPLQEGYGILGAGLSIGAVWAVWHIVPWWVGPWWLGQDHALAVAGQAFGTVIMRLIMGWIYAFGGRSLFLAVAFHAMINTSYKMFPNDGSHFNPSVTAVVLAIMSALIVVPSVIARRSSSSNAS